MINIKIAELNICIENKYDYIKDMCCDYLADAFPNFTVSVSNDEIEAENIDVNNGYKESLAIYRKIAKKIVNYDGFLMHGVVIDVNDYGIAFLAESGVGKTTHIMLWKEYLNDNLTIVNGDKPLVRVINNKIFAYGTPWAGKENMQTNTKTELKKICFIERSEKNECIKINKNEVFERFIHQIYIPSESELFLKAVENIIYVFKNVEFYIIKCNTDISAAETSYKALFE